MKRLLLIVAISAAGLLVAAGAAALALVNGAFNYSLGDLRSAFERPDSRFIIVDGVEYHVIEQGHGPTVLLLHGNIGSHRMWDDWANLLADDFRVVRFDLPAHGLTSPDPAINSADEYIGHGIRRINMLLDELGVDEYAVVGTSFTGITAFRLAASDTQRVRALMLINSGGLPRTAETNPNRRREDALRWWVYGYYFPRERMAEMLRALTGPEFQVSDALIDEYHTLQNLRGRQLEQRQGAARYRAGDAFQILANITQPTMVLWGGANIVLEPAQGEVFVEALTNAPVEHIVYDGVGHLLPIEAPDRGVADLRRLLARDGVFPAR